MVNICMVGQKLILINLVLMRSDLLLKGRSLRVGSDIKWTCSFERLCARVRLKWLYH